MLTKTFLTRSASALILALAWTGAGLAQQPLPLYINAGGGSYQDNQFHNWIADAYFSGGATDSCYCTIFNAGNDQKIYATRRYGSSFSYTVTNLPPGVYQIVFKFADWQAHAAGMRLFNVTVNNAPILNNYDIYAAAGWSQAHDEAANGIQVPLGTLTISFSQNGGSYPAQVNGLVITRTGSLSTSVITGCEEITTPGNYVLNADLAVTSTPCLNLHDTGDNTLTTVNCQGHTITNNTGSGRSVSAMNVPNFALFNCTLNNSTNLYTIWSSESPHTLLTNLTLNNANLEVFSGSDYSSITNNNLTKSTISVYGGVQNVTVFHNILDLNFLGYANPVGIVVADANGAVVSANTVHGDAATHCFSVNGSCTDDGILVAASNGKMTSQVSVHDNTVTDVFDCGIEFVGIVAGVAVADNSISRAGYSGIGGWWGFSMRGGSFTNNSVDHTPGLAVFSYFAGNGYSQASTIDFYGVQLTNNTLTNPVSTTTVNNAFNFSTYASSAQNVYDNILTANDFGGPVNGKLGFSVPIGFMDGGDNVCTSASPSYPSSGFPIACQPAHSCSNALAGMFRGCYYSNLTFSGTPTVMRIDSYPLNFNWGRGLPSCSSNLPALGSSCPNNMSASWIGAFPFEAGGYSFTVSDSGTVMVYIDGQLVFNRWRMQATTFTFSRTVSAGTHTISVKYYSDGGAGQAALALSWAKQ